MNRRGFLKSLLGVSASAALPAKALAFIAENATLSDEAFRSQAIINLLDLRIRAANAAFMKSFDALLYAEATTAAGLAEMVE